MKYLEKTFSSGYNSKLYRNNFDSIFGIKVELELSEETIRIIEKYANKHLMSFDEAVNDILRQEIEKLECEKSLVNTFKLEYI